jgi:hypothetical protein
VVKQDEYGYDLKSGEQVSVAELEAINLRHAAIRDGLSISVEEALSLVDFGEPEPGEWLPRLDTDVPFVDPDNIPVIDLSRVCESCVAAFNADVNGAVNIRMMKSNSESADDSSVDMNIGWLTQPSVYLHDLSCGFSPRDSVVGCKP